MAPFKYYTKKVSSNISRNFHTRKTKNNHAAQVFKGYQNYTKLNYS